MKKLILLFTFFCSYSYLSAQGATLTKEETINYINKKLREVEGYTKTTDKGKTANVISQSMILSDGKISRKLHREFIGFDHVANIGPRDLKVIITDYYNPIHIQSIELVTNANENEAVGTIIIKLLPKSLKQIGEEFVRAPRVDEYDWNLDERTVNKMKYWNSLPETTSENSEAYLYYLKSDPANFNKIKKALEYLQELLKAEDDPFGG